MGNPIYVLNLLNFKHYIFPLTAKQLIVCHHQILYVPFFIMTPAKVNNIFVKYK